MKIKFVVQQIAETAQLHILAELKRRLASKPFRPHRLFRGGHAQTIANYAWVSRRLRLAKAEGADEDRLFEVEPNVSVLVRCHWQKERRKHPTVLLVHGLEGSSESIYMLGTGAKAFAANFNVLRMNMRNCGGTEHLTPTLYNSGMTTDIEAVVRELIERDGLDNIFLVGFSMGGNMVLRIAGERGAELPVQVKAVCAVSPAIDLAACAEKLEARSNWIYSKRFVRSLHRRIHRKHELYPQTYEISELKNVRSVRDFDSRYTVVHGGYRDIEDYYTSASSISFIKAIQRFALILHAQDDPFIPFAAFRDPAIAANPYIILLTPAHGGHVGFVGEKEPGEDRFWAENRIVEFCRFVYEAETANSPQNVR